MTKYRKKFQYVQAPGLAGSTAAKALQVQQALDLVKQQSGQHAQQDIDALRLALQQLQAQALLRGESLAPVQDVQRELLAYEKRYLQHGRSWQQAQQGISGIHGVALVPVAKNAHKGQRYYVQDTETGTRIGKVYVAESRYEPVAAVVGAVHPVFQIRGRPQRHFVQDANNNYVRRFVIRGLNDLDAEKLGGAAPLIPTYTFKPGATAPEFVDATKAETATRHALAKNAPLTPQQQIVSHTRGWYKRFISATTTRRPALSTRGTEFRSLFGAAVVDLAKVPKNQIFDLHAPTVAKTLFGHRTRDIVSAPNQPQQATSLAEEQFLAQRDVIRTREILIHQQLPLTALHCAASAIRVLGFGVASKVQRTSLVQHLRTVSAAFGPALSEEVNRPSQGMNCWIFFQFPTQADLNNALAGALVGFPHPVVTKTLQHYDPVTGQVGNG